MTSNNPKLALVATLTALLFGTACSALSAEHSCTLELCSSSAHGSVTVSEPASALDGIRVEICRNDTCVHTDAADDHGVVRCKSAYPLESASVDCTIEATPAGTKVTATYRGADSEQIGQEDSFRIRLVEPKSGSVVAERAAKPTSFASHKQGGSHCDGDKQCQFVEF